MNKAIMTSVAICSAFAASALTVTDVTARQRWPWNNLVDVDFTVNGDAGDAYAIDISASAAGGEKKLCATTYLSEPIAQSGVRTRIVWDLGADYPNFKADDLRVTVTATPFTSTTPVYLVVDISGGTSATSWPVRYTTTAPTHTAGVNDPCKTTELWLKRVKAGTNTDGSGNGGGYVSSTGAYYAEHTYVLTKDYYLGLFSLTQAQCMNIYGSYQSSFSNETCRATRPVDSIAPVTLRNPYFNSSNPDAALTGCLMKNLRDRTGLKFDLPTEWQWSYACKAGGSASRYTGASASTIRCNSNSKPNSEYEWYSVQGMWSADYGTSYVDAYDPNAWGFYGMLGNVWECCINVSQTITKGETYTDPIGNSGDGRSRSRRGGAWNNDYSSAQATMRTAADPWNGTAWSWGARICLTIGE